ncbi:MAG: hypothetical protein IJY67_03660 [Paludibacteraceae bacterium]|nr:hypothetical protein [Paludibacteraceae bacterium]
MKIVSNVKVESATGRFMVDMRCSYWFGGLNCSPCLIPYEDLEMIIGELRYAQLWLKRRAKLWESYEKVIDAWIVERDRRDAPLTPEMKVWQGCLSVKLNGFVWIDTERMINHFVFYATDLDVVIAELEAAHTTINRLKAVVPEKHPSPKYRDWLKSQPFYDDYLERLEDMYGKNNSIYYYTSEGWVDSWHDIEAEFYHIEAYSEEEEKWIAIRKEAIEWYKQNCETN